MEKWKRVPFSLPPANFGVKLVRPDFGPAAELPALSPARWRHGGCSPPRGSSNVIGGNRRAALALARGTGRTAYTKDVGRTTETVSRPQASTAARSSTASVQLGSLRATVTARFPHRVSPSAFRTMRPDGTEIRPCIARRAASDSLPL